jgi:hypothetical protein
MIEEWLHHVPSLLPGAHLAIVTNRPTDAVEGRMRGLELRDTLLVLLGGPRSAYVFLFRVPLKETTTINQVLATGTGGLDIRSCRLLYEQGKRRPGAKAIANRQTESDAQGQFPHYKTWGGWSANDSGRYPPNVLLVHDKACSEPTCADICPVRILNHQYTGLLEEGVVEPFVPSDLFPIFANESEMLNWLQRLVTPLGIVTSS